MSEPLPLFPLHSVLFPEGPLPLRIFETRYVDLVRRCMKTQSGFGVVLILEGGEVGEVQELATVGTLARIHDFSPLPDGLLGLFCRGERRFRLLSRQRQDDGLHVGEVEWLPDSLPAALPPAFRRIARLVERVLPELGSLYEGVEPRLDDAGWVSARLAEVLPIEQREKQALLEMDDPVGRLERLAPLLRRVDEGEPEKTSD